MCNVQLSADYYYNYNEMEGFIYQSKEFSGAGLSPEIFLSYNDWIGSEEMRFFSYHMKRTAGSMVLHSLLPAGSLDYSL